MNNVVEFPDKRTIEQEAVEWLIRLDGHEALMREERENLKEWLNRSPAHREHEQLQELADLWDKMNILTDLAVPLGKPKRRRVVRWWSYATCLSAIAATVIVVIVLSTGIWHSADPFLDSNGFYATAVGQQESTPLSDGSVVLMNTNTQIKVDFDQGYRNIYLLQGEAHFTVAKNSEIPFRVFAGVGQIRAVGTAFSVYINGDVVDVTVTEGRVSLTSVTPHLAAGEQADIPNQDTPERYLGTLEAGQVATITSFVDEASNRVTTLDNLRTIKEQDISKRLSWTEGVLIFSGEPLEEVVKEISRYTRVSFEFSEPAVRAIRIGGRFPVGETEVMFDALEANFGLEITRLDDHHVLVSAGKQH